MLATQVEYWKYVEGKRHNMAAEALQSESNAINREQVSVNWFTAKENQRHNLAQEDIGYTNAHENIRHNMVSEEIERGKLSETVRHNRAQESIGYQNAYANVTSANAAQRNASINFGRLTLDQEMQPYKISQTQGQAYQSKAAGLKSEVEANLAPTRLKLDSVEVVGNLWTGTLGALGKLIGPSSKRR